MLRDLEAIVFCEEAAEFDFRDGMFHIEQSIGDSVTIKRCFTPNTFFKMLANANSAAARWHAEQREQVEFIRVFPSTDDAARLAAS